jgi:hypothetical protein
VLGVGENMCWNRSSLLQVEDLGEDVFCIVCCFIKRH